MPRATRNVYFVQMRVQKADHEYLFDMKRGSAEQLDCVLHRILGDYRNKDVGQLQELYNGQIKSTQFWMHRAIEAESKLKARNMVLDQVMCEK
jgi:hypothetical protein